MYRTPAIGTLLILALCIVCEVLSAPREKMIREISGQEKFLQTREAELLELTRAARDERSHESREDEVKQRQASSTRERPPIVKREDKDDATKKPTIIDKPKDNSTSIAETNEAKDMRESKANPKDDDDATTVTQSSKVPETTVKNSANVDQSTNKTSSDPSVKPRNDIPDNKTALNVTTETNSNAVPNKTNEAVKPSTNNSITSSTILPPISAVTSEQSVTSPTTSNEATNATAASATTTATMITTATEKSATKTPVTTITNAPTAATATPAKPTSTSISSSTKSEAITNNSMTTSSMEMMPSEAERKLHEKKLTPMPSGVVALITAIAFAIVAVMAYVGLVVWRRYLEWRYGNRELLVNEFDSNDIGNFEL